MSTSSSEVSFKQYGGNAAENYERYFVPTIGAPFATALLDTAAPRLVSASSTSHAAQES